MKVLILVIYFFISSISYAEDYSFEIPGVESRKEILELSGNLDVKYSILKSKKTSPLYNLQYYNQQLSDVLSSYRMEFYFDGDYQTRDIGVHFKTHSEYYNDTQADFNAFELYGNLNFSVNSYLLLGKKMHKWGTGYAFNPVGYVNPIKDPENPELSQAGIFSIYYQYSKSFQTELIKNAAFDLIIKPSTTVINNKISELGNTDIAGKLYFLFYDTDIDFMWYYSKINAENIGFDFSRNILPNLEVHGEYSRFYNRPFFFTSNNSIKSENSDGSSGLVGLRWLNRRNITSIVEYYHNGAGLHKKEFENYTDLLINAAVSENSNSISSAMNISSNYFSGTNLMRDYLYLKVSWPEPFNLVYFTPSIYTIFNITDESSIVGIPLSYKPITNFEFILWPVFLTGNKNAEFGSKQYKGKLDIWMRYYF